MGNNQVRNILLDFLVLIPIVILIQLTLLNIILQNGFTGDDWLLLFDYKTTSPGVNFLDKLSTVFHVKGIYTTNQVFYIGILESLFRDNYQAYQITNIIFKILATLSLYPLISTVFKRRLLAFLTTILYAISYSSSGALQFVVKGSDYLAIFFMNIFLLSYYYSFITRRKLLLPTVSILLFLSFIFSPIRIYPLLSIVFLIEVFVWIKSRKLFGFRTLLARLMLLFIPFLVFLGSSFHSAGGYLNGPFVVYKFLSYGNYQLLLSPFAGLGYTFLPNDYWGLFGQVNIDSFREYLLFLFKGPVIIYSLLTILLSLLITRKPSFFISAVILANILFGLICYFLITNLREATGPNIKSFHPISTYAIFFGFFVFSVAVSGLFVWLRKQRSNTLLLALFAGPIFASVFLWGTWFIIGDNLTFKEGIHWYLIIPPMGSSLFIASLIVLCFDRIKLVVNPYLKYILIVSLFLTILPLYLISKKEINTTFGNLLDIGYRASDQEEMKSKLISQIREPIDGRNVLFYLDTSEDLQTPQLFYPTTLYLIAGFSEMMHFHNWEIINSCLYLILDKTTLEKSIIVKDGVKGFNANSLCVENYFEIGRREVFYRPDNFYAFKLKDKEVIDITQEVLERLGVK